MIDDDEVWRDLARAGQALDQAVAFLASCDAVQAALMGTAPTGDSPLMVAVRDGRLAVDRVAAYLRALAGQAPRADRAWYEEQAPAAGPVNGAAVNGAAVNGAAVRRLALLSHGDPGE